MREAKKRIFVVDDHPMLRAGLVKFLNSQPDMEVCAEAGTASEVMKVLESESPDGLLMDLSLGNHDGLEFIKQLRALRPALPLLVFSMHNEETFAIRALDAGANGYLMKDEAPENVVSAMRAILQGEIALSRKMTTRLLKVALERGSAPMNDPVARQLSDRELHVFRLIGAELTPKKIAQALSLSVKTIETHIANIKVKLCLNNAAELSCAAREWINQA